VARVAGLPLFASIPVLDRKLIYDGDPPSGMDWRVVVQNAPGSAAADQYRSFLPHYLQADSPSVVLVTSSAPGDGKSVTCANLACSLATDLGHRVLLIDADLRRASMHRLLNVGREPGLANVLRGEASLTECAVSPAKNLSILTAGAGVRNPLALLTSEAFFELRARACETYEVVLIDSPPVLPVIDGRLLRRVADMVVFVVRARATPPANVVRSLQELGNVSGVILNDVSPASFLRYYHYDAYARYGYPEAEPPEEHEAARVTLQ
jgi:capsular exopolysaccharide synthesis family protein